jgi:hypothetical protein
MEQATANTAQATAAEIAAEAAPQILTAAVEIVRKWSFADVVGRFEPLAEMAGRHGLLASLFGSTLERGIGNDLDVLMSPRRDMRPDRDGFLAEFGGVETARTIDESKNIWCIKLSKGGRYYDFAFGTVGKPRGA